MRGLFRAARGLLTTALVLAAAPTLAGDRALLDLVGFSQDFRYFAFEEFGIQDGSGFAYANLYIVDLSTDSWVVGTPIRVRADDEERSLGAVRAEALSQAQSHIDDFRIEVPADLLALNGDGAPASDGKKLAFGFPTYLPGALSGDYALSLATFDTKAASPCAEWFGSAPKGYALTIADNGTKRLVHRDAGLPRSRGCPSDYRIHGVVAPFGSASLSNAVAIISVYPGGFEGPDRRFLAVPLGL
ncbi:MAG: hypothetical protein ABS75_30595 [Pelagibacterium sp. SCN 63-23]|nr:MAG: hypothetical protein ABS75_30595 [Pelagibacterium sp. SCN 63-23]